MAEQGAAAFDVDKFIRDTVTSELDEKAKASWDLMLASQNPSTRNLARGLGVFLGLLASKYNPKAHNPKSGNILEDLGASFEKTEKADRHLRSAEPLVGPVEEAQPPPTAPATPATLVQLESINLLPYCDICENVVSITTAPKWTGGKRHAPDVAVGVAQLCQCAVEKAKAALIAEGWTPPAPKSAAAEEPGQLRLTFRRPDDDGQ